LVELLESLSRFLAHATKEFKRVGGGIGHVHIIQNTDYNSQKGEDSAKIPSMSAGERGLDLNSIAWRKGKLGDLGDAWGTGLQGFCVVPHAAAERGHNAGGHAMPAKGVWFGVEDAGCGSG
jgi:hypothetical protein